MIKHKPTRTVLSACTFGIICATMAAEPARTFEQPPAAQPVPAKIEIADGPFQPTWESLKQDRCPDWFRDAKLGIWGILTPQSLPEAGDWYARHMYIEGMEQYNFHLEHFGHPSKFGYKDLAALWKLDDFDPDRLMQLYKKVGAGSRRGQPSWLRSSRGSPPGRGATVRSVHVDP